MKRAFLFLLIIAGLFAIGYFLAVGSGSSGIIKRSRILLGTVVEIQIRNENEDKANRAVEEAFNEIKRIDKVFSAYEEEGEIFKINNSSDTLFNLSTDLERILKYSDSLWKITGGAFDVSLFELMKVWGFTGEPSFPGNKKIQAALDNSGWKKVSVDTFLIKKGNVKFDFGAIAKGYAVDKAVDVLKKNGIKEALVDAGGEIKSTHGDWKIGIQDPVNPDNIVMVLKLKGMSVATSGDYEQYFEHKGKRYHHILDPATGYPGNKCKSVTVISKENYWADGLATGIFIMGAAEGISLVEELQNTEAMIIDSSGKKWMSSGFEKYIVR